MIENDLAFILMTYCFVDIHLIPWKDYFKCEVVSEMSVNQIRIKEKVLWLTLQKSLFLFKIPSTGKVLSDKRTINIAIL